MKPSSWVIRLVGCLWAVCLLPLVCQALSIDKTTTNGRINPLGIAADDISFGWSSVAEERSTMQRAYHIRVGITQGGSEVWDSGRVESDRQVDVRLPSDRPLAPATRYFWQVRIWDATGRESDWSEPSWFETGLLSVEDWDDAWRAGIEE